MNFINAFDELNKLYEGTEVEEGIFGKKSTEFDKYIPVIQQGLAEICRLNNLKAPTIKEIKVKNAKNVVIITNFGKVELEKDLLTELDTESGKDDNMGIIASELTNFDQCYESAGQSATGATE